MRGSNRIHGRVSCILRWVRGGSGLNRRSADQDGILLRLFLIPGVHPGGGGPGLTEFDALTALENWVEKGEAPEKLIA